MTQNSGIIRLALPLGNNSEGRDVLALVRFLTCASAIPEFVLVSSGRFCDF